MPLNKQAAGAGVVLVLIIAATVGCSSQLASMPTKPAAADIKGDGKPGVNAADNEGASTFKSRIQALTANDASDPHSHDIEEAYAATGDAAIWIRENHPTVPATALIEAFLHSRQKGLSPGDYEASQWPGRLEALKNSRGTPDALAQFDVDLTLDAARYVSDLRVGRANPKPLPFIIKDGQNTYDLGQFIQHRLAVATDVPAQLSAVEPNYAAYRRTEEALQTYLAFAKKSGSAPLPPVTKPLSPGALYPAADSLEQRLQLLRDEPATVSNTVRSGQYTGAMVEGVKHFQVRHGLTADGRLTNDTIAALNTPLSTRITQLEDALERWRWLPSDYPQLPVAVNIPEFVLRAFTDYHRIVLRSNVVVGKAFGHQTPVFAKTIQYIIFRPYWNVPLSITRNEIIPHLQRSSSYLAHEQLEITDHAGNVMSAGAVNPAMVDALRSGKWMVRQRPGAENSLGLIKFIFPNEDNVYLHSTPAPQLFSRPRRDFSHGCIRVEKPAELAAWLLRDQPAWTLDAVHAAMESGKDNRQVNLTRPVPVVIVYMTAVVEEDGEIFFFNDIYGQDKTLNAVLAKGPPYRQ